MAAATYDLMVEQGSTFRLSMVYGSSDGTLDTDGNQVVTPYDLTGCKARLQVRQRRSGPVLISATTENGGIQFPDPSAGRILVTFSDEATDSLNMRRAKYDLEVEWPSGDVSRALQGNVKISPNITQDANLDNISPGVTDVYDVDEQDVDTPG